MKSMYVRTVFTFLMIGLLSACGTQATATTPPDSASQPTDLPVAPTQTVTDTPASVDTAIPAASPIPATEVPATQAPVQAATVSFANDILPLFNSRCANCHGGNQTEEGLTLLTYAGVLQGSEHGPVVVPGSADNSLLVEQVVSQEMPKRGPKLTPAQIQLIIDWINQGALDN